MNTSLLFGVLALQADLIDTSQFAQGCALWAERPEARLADILREQGWLTGEDKTHVDFLVERHLRKHQGNSSSYVAGHTNGQARQALESIESPPVQQTLMQLSTATDDVSFQLAEGITPQERYRLVSLHAKGGIGQVWRAHDDVLDREVALKELRPEWVEDTQAQLRFLTEARVTGRLQHPSIVPLYDVVRRGDGQAPSYTMRLIQGRTLHDAIVAYHQKRQAGRPGPLELRELLGAFVAVCNAIAYAHSRGVIHRDLKGQNIVLGDFGEVIVLDWGLAKIVGQADERSDRASAAAEPGEDNNGSVQGQVLGTPGYMAPEQAAARLDELNERTDVYGLGAILYEMLTGQPPFSGTNQLEVVRQVIEEPPLSPRQRVPSTPAALEAVCLKALAKQPDMRYRSARELAQDVQHWLADEPVAAYGEPWTVKTRRWLGRHRTLTSAIAAAAVVTLVSLTIAAMLLEGSNRREREARADERLARLRAERNLQLARAAVDRGFTKVSDSPQLKARGLERLRKELLSQAKDFYESMVREGGNEPGVQADRGLAYLRLAELTAQTGDRPQAIQFCKQAEQVLSALSRDHPEAPGYQKDLARSLRALASYYREAGEMVPSKSAYDQALAVSEKLIAAHPREPAYRSQLAATLADVGWWYTDNGQKPRAEASLQRALAIARQLTDDHPESAEYRVQLATTLHHLGRVQAGAGKLNLATGNWEEALPIYEALAREYPGVPDYQSQLALTYYNLAAIYSNTRQPARVKAIYEQARPAVERLSQEHPDVPAYRDRLASLQTLYAMALALLGDHAPAAAEIENVVALGVHDGLVLYNAACVYTVCSTAVSKDTHLPAAERDRHMEQYQARAVALLRQADQMAYFKALRHVQTLQKDTDLDPLRSRTDFQALVQHVTSAGKSGK